MSNFLNHPLAEKLARKTREFSAVGTITSSSTPVLVAAAIAGEKWCITNKEIKNHSDSADPVEVHIDNGTTQRWEMEFGVGQGIGNDLPVEADAANGACNIEAATGTTFDLSYNISGFYYKA